MKLFGIILFALATITTASIAHARHNRISLRNKLPTNNRRGHPNTIAGNMAGAAPLRRKARDMQLGGGAVESDWIEFYADPFYPYFEQYASAHLGFPATIVDKEFQDFVLDMTSDDWYMFFLTLGTQVNQWVGGNVEIIDTMSDAEFDAMSNSIKF